MNPKRAAYNRLYYRRTKGCLLFLPLVLIPFLVGLSAFVKVVLYLLA